MTKIDSNSPVTYKVFRKTLTEELTAAVEETVEKIGEMMEQGFAETKKGFAQAKKERQRIELELKREINDLKVDTPTQKEFNGLEKRVTRLESFHSH
ncbi:MAG: hypothetical protein HYS86_01845 [Candidatus Chisholmbacteria bacterium]|nr:hypothetical protein [Candidatus Chisholmbacteria bacterium]